MIFFRSFFLFFIFLLFLGCRNEVDEVPPQITWLFPAENNTFSTLDEIFVEAEIQDNESIKAIQLGLFRKSDNRQVQGNNDFSPNSKLFRLAVNFLIKDSLLESGTYYFRILADDGENVKAAFRDIQINTVPKVRLNTIVACENGNGVQFFKDNNDFNFSAFLTDPNSLTEAVVNSIDQQYWMLSKRGGYISVFDLKENSIAYQNQLLSNFSELFTSVDFEDRTVLIAAKDGEIKGFNERFQNNFTYRAINPGRSILNLKANHKYVLAEEADLNGSNRSVQLIFRNTANSRAELAINQQVKAIYFTSLEMAILFQNNANGGLLSEVDIQANGVRTMKTFRDSIISVTQISDKDYFISTPNKIMRYDFSTNTSFDFLTFPNAVIAYEELNNQLLIGSNQTLSVYSLNPTNLVAQATLPSRIMDIDVRFNR